MAGSTQTITILPGMAAFARDLFADVVKAAEDSGKSASKAWSDAFAATDKGKAQKIVDDLRKADTEIRRMADEQSAAVKRARAAEAEAAVGSTRALQALTDAQSRYGSTANTTRAAQEQYNAALLRHSAASSDAARAQRDLLDTEGKLRDNTDKLNGAYGNLGNAAAGQSTAWGTVKATMAQANAVFGDAGKAVGNVVGKLTEAFGATNLFSDAWKGALDLDSGLAKATVALDLTKSESEKAGKVAGELYTSAYGDSLSGVTGSVSTVMSIMTDMRDASAEDLQAVTAAALDLSDVFGIDVKTSATAASALLRDGLAVDAMGAFDLMTASLQRIPETMRGDLVGAASEYSSTFAELGLTGEQAFGALIGAMENGQVSFATTGSALENLTKNATSMSETSVSAYAAAGLSADEMASRFAAGGSSASGALVDLANGLLGIEDPATRAQAATALFGDLPEGEIDSFLGGLADMGGQLTDVTGSAAEMGDTMKGTTASSVEELQRGFKDLVTDGLQPLIDPAMKFLSWVTDLPGGIEAFAIVLGTLAAAWKTYTVAQWAANAGLLSCPMVWIITGIVAAIGLLAAGITLIVKNWDDIVAWFQETWEPVGEWFSNVWNGITEVFSTVWTGIQEVAGTVVVWFQENVQPVFEAVWGGICAAADIAWQVLQVIFLAIATAFTLVGEGLVWVWETLIAPVWEFLRAGAEAVWLWIDATFIQPLLAGWNMIGGAISWVINNVILAGWNWLMVKLQEGWAFIDQWILQPFRLAWDALGAAFAWVKDNVILPVWDGIRSFLSEGWNWISEHVFEPIKSGVDAIGKVFETTKGLIETAWNGIKKAAAAPVNFIIDTVYNGGIKKTWDSIAEKVGLNLRLPKLERIATEADGTEDHRAQIAPAGAWRLWAEPETGGEAYIPLSAAKRGRSTRILAEVASRFGYGLQEFGGGGFFSDPLGWVGDTIGRGAAAAWDWTKDAVSATVNFLKDPVKALGELITKPMNALLEGIGAGDIGKLIAGVPRKAVGWVIDFVKNLVGIKNDEAAKSMGGGAGGPGMGWRAMWNVLRAAFPWAILTSAERAGAVTAVGTKSLHGMGRAIDVSPSMDIFSWIKANYPNSTEIIYSPAGGGQVYKGRPQYYGEPTRSMHFNHVHWGMADGGVLDSAFWRVLAQGGVLDDRLERTLYDSGGLLQPGLTLVENRTGRPEPVLSAAEFEQLAARGDAPRYELTINNHERPLTAHDVVSATRQVELLNPRR